MRTPASRKTGSAKSSMEGYGRTSASSIASRDGLTVAKGGGGASRIATTSFGGNL
jgi:hypothetical protein